MVTDSPFSHRLPRPPHYPSPFNVSTQRKDPIGSHPRESPLAAALSYHIDCASKFIQQTSKCKVLGLAGVVEYGGRRTGATANVLPNHLEKFQ
jgi:hypothetical protein